MVKSMVLLATQLTQLRFKTYFHHFVVSLKKTLYGTFLCLVVLEKALAFSPISN